MYFVLPMYIPQFSSKISQFALHFPVSDMPSWPAALTNTCHYWQNAQFCKSWQNAFYGVTSTFIQALVFTHRITACMWILQGKHLDSCKAPSAVQVIQKDSFQAMTHFASIS